MSLRQGFIRAIVTRLVRVTTVPLAVVMALASSQSFSQSSNPHQVKDSAPSPAASATVKPPIIKPNPAMPVKSGWSLLTPDQQRALQPLARTWDTLNPAHQRKWVEISRNYPSLSTADKAKMHSRMSEWVALSPRERAEARLNFAATHELSKELSPQEKQAKWESYQSLSPEEKRKLAEAGVRPPVGAALPSRPVAQKKLATLPPAETATKAPKIGALPVAVSQQPVPAE
jgi:hypothetical protein